MEGEQKRAGWKIWVYLTPVYILIAVPLVKWTMKINSSDVALSKDEVNVFNATEGEVKKRQAAQGYDPGLNDLGYSVRYRAGGAAEGSMPGDGPSREELERVRQEAARKEQATGRQEGGGQQGARGNPAFAPNANQAALESNSTRAKEAMGMGAQKGYLSYAIGKVANSPKAVGAIMNNKYVVEGFMSRATVKAATGSPQGLANFLKGDGPMNFMNNPVVKAALNNPALVSAFATSSMATALMNTPAAQALMKDPQALGDLVNNNPQLMAMVMQNPQALSTLMSNPDVTGIVNKFDTSKVRKF